MPRQRIEIRCRGKETDFEKLRGRNGCPLPRPGQHHVHPHLAEADGHHAAGLGEARFQDSIGAGGRTRRSANSAPFMPLLSASMSTLYDDRRARR